MPNLFKACLPLVFVTIAVYGTAFAQDPAGEEPPQQPAEQESPTEPAGEAVAQETEIEVDPKVAAREATFKETTDAFSNADELDARLLSPKHYEEAQKSFETAQVIYDRGGSLEDIHKELSKSAESLKLATRAAELSQVALKDLLAVRAEVLATGLSFADSRDFREAEKKFREATEKIEKDDLKGSRKPSDQAVERYRKAVLQVLEKEVISDAKKKLKDSKNAYTKEDYKLAENSLKDLEKYVKSQKDEPFSITELTARVNEEIEQVFKQPAPEAESSTSETGD